MTDIHNIDGEEYDDMEDINLSELSQLDLTSIDENITYNIFEDNFPQCYINRVGET